MLSPFVSWILSSSSSSTSSSDGEENIDTGDGDYENNNDGNEDDEHFYSEPEESPSASCARAADIPVALALPVPDASPNVTVAIPGTDETSSLNPDSRADTSIVNHRKRQRLNYSRNGRQYHRLWTKQDEMELLKGYLDYITQQRHRSTNSLQNDVAFFYDHVKPKLKVDFNQNQFVEKLRRLKRKHKVVSEKINCGEGAGYSFKNPQDDAIFEISHKIWGKSKDQNALGDDESCPCPNTVTDAQNFSDNKVKTEEVGDVDEMENVVPRLQKRSRLMVDDSAAVAVAMANDEKNNGDGNTHSIQIEGLIEETMRSCLPPLLDELLNNALEGTLSAPGLEALKPEEQSTMNSTNEEMGEEKWKKRSILELEVYLKRLEMLQDKIKARLEELRSRTQ
ncbi:hypothetical protein L6164_010568 [Bauhinia variegata]|uniref:Uncharacterized protein n=1 Tax=Bauhinia variegata TaxID=167791 RepID=A0ACB9PR37_BAUVA|nr:hypothetical protein L6164_010568 [Bauhinia variegata]